ncbi:hypothetical protein O4G76_15845 [Limimaricola sp. G21655-S1]|uniref:hypothetical protein n=1 Tax=Limimaricola sp. G21655-S1 TaxID=3014768 RepID=UPI0022B06165|nr:hypothetical protein [Limimaricola sp. G21655-S1]MCZ4262313.1 hypothetical protein [Limimaricola sp. G21655-S1]
MQIEITVAIDLGVYEWLSQAAERTDIFRNIEQLVNESLNLFVGRGCPRTLMQKMADVNGYSLEEFIFGDIHGGAEKQAVRELYMAAALLANHAEYGFLDDGEDLSVTRLLAMMSLSLQGQRDAGARLISPSLHDRRPLRIPVPEYPLERPRPYDDDEIPF